MDKETEKKALAALDRQRKQYARQNDYIKNNFERVSVTLPKGTKEKIKEEGKTANGLINELIANHFEEGQNRKANRDI